MSENVPTITWKVTNLDCYPKYDQETDVVFTVHWDCLGNMTVATGSLSGSVYNSRLYGTTGVMYHSGSTFTPYSQLTEPQVLTWVFDAMGQEQKDNIEAGTANAIYTQIDPPVVNPPLPWAPVPPSITLQPVGLTIGTGQDATFTFEATGSLPLSYQWFKNSGTISGATSNTLTITSASFSDGASYFASVNNAGGTVTTNVVTLSVTGSLPPTP
jgi:hypothetical protein